ncbi:hypothetical protein IW492_00330 [Enterococcus sp. BWB1-3]|uniref:hypothetical protein n=1 Tax=unclassified Enterococcus TaxID=2608891 RepID=UPI001920E8E4|nr:MULTISPECIES: hypothetical protein [unclassified Enterococcus]MBL1227675.1 hypothetical protein [Enterococcus sp. BWB1-3]MCB5952138.1 hypothetical protein [Enterococcus sp. BWT-B8]MCB5954455.1 hypothetical protein [Enterococcus sp. CWB-B31]
MNIYSIKISPNRPFNKSELNYLLERCTILSKKAEALDYIKKCSYTYDQNAESFNFDFICIHDEAFSLNIVKDNRSNNHTFSMQNYEKWAVLRKDFLKQLKIIDDIHTGLHN